MKRIGGQGWPASSPLSPQLIGGHWGNHELIQLIKDSMLLGDVVNGDYRSDADDDGDSRG